MLYTNKEWLEREVSQGKSGAKIGREIGVSDTIINRWIKKFDLREKEENLYQDKEWLTEEYITKNRRAKDIIFFTAFHTTPTSSVNSSSNDLPFVDILIREKWLCDRKDAFGSQINITYNNVIDLPLSCPHSVYTV